VAHEYAYWSEGKQGKHDRPRSVAQGKPNAFGLYDMHGNMMEWIADWLHDFYYLESLLNDPTGPANMNEERNQRRMVRGGAFEVGQYWSRSAFRLFAHPDLRMQARDYLAGVRLVINLP